jgi:hypothetical protein
VLDMKDHTLDELMIVNPGRPDRLHRVRLARPAAEEPRLFLGDDGVVYQAVPARLGGCRCGHGSPHPHVKKER